MIGFSSPIENVSLIKPANEWNWAKVQICQSHIVKALASVLLEKVWGKCCQQWIAINFTCWKKCALIFCDNLAQNFGVHNWNSYRICMRNCLQLNLMARWLYLDHTTNHQAIITLKEFYWFFSSFHTRLHHRIIF